MSGFLLSVCWKTWRDLLGSRRLEISEVATSGRYIRPLPEIGIPGIADSSFSDCEQMSRTEPGPEFAEFGFVVGSS
jgi:hypothetical protein